MAKKDNNKTAKQVALEDMKASGVNIMVVFMNKKITDFISDNIADEVYQYTVSFRPYKYRK